MSRYRHTELTPARRLQPGDVVAGPAGLARVAWVFTRPRTNATTLWWADTSRTIAASDLPVLIVTRPPPPHDKLGPERVNRVRAAALGAAWVRHAQHPGAPGDSVYAMLCDAYAKVVWPCPDVPSHLLLLVLSARTHMAGQLGAAVVGQVAAGVAHLGVEPPKVWAHLWN